MKFFWTILGFEFLHQLHPLQLLFSALVSCCKDIQDLIVWGPLFLSRKYNIMAIINKTAFLHLVVITFQRLVPEVYFKSIEDDHLLMMQMVGIFEIELINNLPFLILISDYIETAWELIFGMMGDDADILEALVPQTSL